MIRKMLLLTSSHQCQYKYLLFFILLSLLLTIQVSMVHSQGMMAIPSQPSSSSSSSGQTITTNIKEAQEKAEIHKKIAADTLQKKLAQSEPTSNEDDSAAESTSATEEQVSNKIIRKDKPVELQNAQKHASDEWLLHFLLEQYSLSETSDSNVEEQVDILQNLEHFAHKFENGRDLFQSTNALKKILLPALNSTYPEIRKASCGVFAVAAQNNQIVQTTALQNGVVRRLVHLLTFDLASVRSKALYALSSLLRNYPEAQKKFIQDGGLSALVKAASLSETRKRSLNFVTDLLLERRYCRNEAEASPIVDDNTTDDLCDNERLLEKSLQANGYCEILAESLNNVGSFDTDHQTFITEAIDAGISFCVEAIAPYAVVLHKLLIKFERDESTSAAQLVQTILAQVDPLSLASRDEL